MQSGVKTLSAGGGASLCCLLLLWLIYSHLLREGKDTYLFITLSAAPVRGLLIGMHMVWSEEKKSP